MKTEEVINQMYNKIAKLKLEKERLYAELENAVKQLQCVEALLNINPQAQGKTIDCNPAIQRYISTLNFIDDENS